jgi:hypothetical protein
MWKELLEIHIHIYIYRQPQQTLSLQSTDAACFGHTVNPQELNIMYFMPEDEDVFA